MIVPLVPEEQWLQLLKSAPVWNRDISSAVILVPHPDDEVLCIGGLIASLRCQNTDVVVIAVTDGECAYPDIANLSALRSDEQSAALSLLGMSPDKIVRLRLPDGNVSSLQSSLTTSVMPYLTEQTALFAPWTSDHHPDHEACGRAAGDLASATGCWLYFYLFWAWHFKTLSDLQHQNIFQFHLDPDLETLKAQALQCHRSQLGNQFGPPIVYPPLLAPSQRHFEAFIVA